MKNILLTSFMLLAASVAGFHTHADLLQRRTPPFPGAPDGVEPYRAAVAAGCKMPAGAKLASRDLDELERLLSLTRRAALAAPLVISDNDYSYPVPKGAAPIGAKELINAVKTGNPPTWFTDKLKELKFDCTGYGKKQTGGAAGGSDSKAPTPPSVRRRWSWEDEFEDLWVRDEIEMDL